MATCERPRNNDSRTLLNYFKEKFNCNSVFSIHKGIFMILLWNFVVGIVYAGIMYSMIVVILQFHVSTFNKAIYLMVGVVAIFALIQMLFYPVWGLIADICCGRYRIITLSIFTVWCATLLFGIACIIQLVHINYYTLLVYPILSSIAILMFLTGISGFQANVVQFGLDQLMDAPSNKLSLFLHWFIWSETLGQLLVRLMGAASLCSDLVKTKLFPYAAITFTVIICVLMVLSCCKHQWFHNEPCTHNPYGTVYRVLKFAAKHDKPLQRSALTYCDDERPTRMEFAKQRYGGPFTTEMVEDVKTFLKILVMLLVISPISTVQVNLNYAFPIFGIHLGNSSISDENGCSPEWMLLQSGNLSYIFAVVMMPLYITIIHPRVPKWMPRILFRFSIGTVLMFTSVAVTFAIQVVANYDALHKQDRNVSCMFLSDIHDNQKMLNFQYLSLIVPNLLTGTAFPLVHVTFLEFISAQSPHTMKGLLLGVFHSFRGFFTLIGCVLIFPFARNTFWRDTTRITDCGFYYYLLGTILGSICVATMLAATKWYKYRVREDRPYGPSYVEDYYSRYLNRMNIQAISPLVDPEETDHSE